MLLPLDHHVLHAAVVAGLARPQGLAEPAGSDVAAQEQRVVGVGGAHLVIQTINRRCCTITFTFNTLLRHYAKQTLSQGK